MATNDFSGNYLIDLDGTAHNSPASTILASMLSAGQYSREQSTLGTTEVDNVAINIDRSFLFRCNRSYENQKLLSQFAFHAHQITDHVIRLSHRTLSSTFTLAEAMASVGMVVNSAALGDAAFAGTGTSTTAWQALNQELANHGMALWRA